ncbi:hypothetical protein [Candidatus Burkholderia verschuerenii]|uniref:hypothetical protein n=1 Tax=Candidatus Burkholderia verschuerenii TaxID=242163 RepID=UPI00067CFA99|nr:hypothetical protein [Candidatus Burkholderia verschuerenii]
MIDGDGRQGPANDNRAPEGEREAKGDASERLDTVVFSIARLIGRRLAREHFETLRAANDNAPFIDRKESEDGSPGSDNDE